MINNLQFVLLILCKYYKFFLSYLLEKGYTGRMHKPPSLHVPPQPRLVWITLACFALLLIVAPTLLGKPKETHHLETSPHPTLGDVASPLQIVAFEEPKCPQCKRYSMQLFPQLKQEFLDTGKASYSLILVSFLPHSMPAANALLSVYRQDPDHPNSPLFFAYLETLYRNQPDESEDWATPERLLAWAAETSSEIDLARLRENIEKETYRAEVEANTQYGAQLMHPLSTPTLYINGVEMDDLTYAKVRHTLLNAKRDEDA